MMNDQRLDELLELQRRKTAPAAAFEPAECFQKRFFERVERRRSRMETGRRLILGLAAALLLGAGFWLFPAGAAGSVEPAVKLEMAQRLFGDERAVLFFGDELILGDHSGSGGRRLPLRVRLTQPDDGRPIDLNFAGTECDSISFASAELSGTILTSRSDRDTVVLELELRWRKGNRIDRRIIPVRCPAGDGVDS